MKVYLVICSSGEYEDYSSWVEKVFADKSKAEAFIKKYNEHKNDDMPINDEIYDKICNEIDNISNDISFEETNLQYYKILKEYNIIWG